MYIYNYMHIWPAPCNVKRVPASNYAAKRPRETQTLESLWIPHSEAMESTMGQECIPWELASLL